MVTLLEVIENFSLLSFVAPCLLVQGEHERGNVVGLNHNTGEPIDPQMEGIFDNYSVKRQIINSGYVVTHYLAVCRQSRF